MDKRTVSYRAIALALGIALVGAGFGLWSARETAVIKRGLAEGFAINGMFQERQPGRSTLAFLDEEGRWQHVDEHGDVMNGTFKRSAEPNGFVLLDEAGGECGSVHLTFTSKDGLYGTLYLQADDEIVRFDKTDRVPAFMEQ